jgi:hypothetical protein
MRSSRDECFSERFGAALAVFSSRVFIPRHSRPEAREGIEWVFRLERILFVTRYITQEEKLQPGRGTPCMTQPFVWLAHQAKKHRMSFTIVLHPY